MVGCYCRVSTDRQKDNYSIQKQREDAETFSKSRKSSFQIYEDIWSGGDITRKGWNKLFDDIRNKKIDTIWVGKIDRFSRNTRDGLMAIELFKKHNTSFFVGGVEYNPHDETTYLLITMQFAIAQYEKSQILQRTLSGRIKAYNSGARKLRTVYGFDSLYDNKGRRFFTINPLESEVVKKVFDCYLYKDMSMIEISKQLNREGVLTKEYGQKRKVRGENSTYTIQNEWTQVQIRGILKRPEYIGKSWNYDKTELVDSLFYKGFIDVNDWNKVQEIRSGFTYKYKTRASKNLLSGLFECSECGAKYFVETANRVKGKRHQEAVKKVADYIKDHDVNRLLMRKDVPSTILGSALSEYNMSELKELEYNHLVNTLEGLDYYYLYYKHKKISGTIKKCKCKIKLLRKEKLDNMIKVLFIENFTLKRHLDNYLKKSTDKRSELDGKYQMIIERFGNQLNDYSNKRKNLMRQVMLGTFTDDDIKEMKNEIDTEIKKITDKKSVIEKEYLLELDKYNKAHEAITTEIVNEFIDGNDEMKRNYLKKFITSIKVNSTWVTVEFITEKRFSFDIGNLPNLLLDNIDDYIEGHYTAESINELRNWVENKEWRNERHV